MKKSVKIQSTDKPKTALRSITDADQENLRTWKNKHRTSFFYQEIITPEQQKEWFRKYLGRQNDYMFIVEEEPMGENAEKERCPVGCLAFRLEDDSTIDLYNIIRGRESVNVTMKDAMHLMLNYIKTYFPDKRIKCDVLKDNPAVLWYKKCGFAIWEEKEYYIMGIERPDIPRVDIVCSEEE